MHFFFGVITFFINFLSTQSIYEEQFGEFDWKIENIGFLEHTVYHSKKFYVSTTDGVIACINPSTGVSDWRVVLPEGEAVLQMVVGAGQLFTLGRNVVRGWTLTDGTLIWDALTSTNETDITQDFAGKILFSSDLSLSLDHGGKLTVLSNNRISIYDLEGQLIWTVSSTDVSKDLSTTESGRTFFFSQLVHQSSNPTKSQDLAIGCVTDGVTCISTAVISAELVEKTSSTKLFPGIPVSPSNLRAAFSSEPKSDILFGVSGGTDAWLVHALDLNSKASGSFAIKTTNAPVANLYLTGGAVQPVISYCEKGCSAVTFAKVIRTINPESLISCDGYGAVIGRERSAFYPYIVTLGCASNVRAGGEDKGPVVRVEFSAGVEESKGSGVSVSLADSAVMSHSVLGSLFLQHQQSPDLKQSKSSFSYLLQTSTGDLLYVKNDVLLWKRSEALAVVRDSVVVSRTPHLAVESGSQEELPDWQTRLKFQQIELKDWFRDTAAFLNHLPETFMVSVTESVSGLLGDKFGGLPEKRNLSPEERIRQREASGAQFGFEKVAVCLSSRIAVDWSNHRIVEPASVVPLSGLVSRLGLSVTGVDMVLGKSTWSFVPDLSRSVEIAESVDGGASSSWSADAARLGVVVMAKLLLVRPHRRSQHPPQVVLVVSLCPPQDGSLALVMYWVLDVTASGATTHLAAVHKSAPLGPSFAVVMPRIRTISALGRKGPHGDAVFLQVHDGPSVSVFPPPESEEKLTSLLRGQFVHVIDGPKGVLQTYKVDVRQAGRDKGLLYFGTEAVASAVLDPVSETIVSVTYPASHVLDSAAPSRTTVLGDDSLLLKYLNPHVVALASKDTSGLEDGTSLHITLLDTVSARVIYRVKIIDGGCGSVLMHILGHRLFVSYWHCKAKRTELLSVAMYEGMIDKYGLGPLSRPYTFKATSSFTAPPPIAMEKTFILPKGVRVMQQTFTTHDLTNKMLLLALSTGQVLACDLRWVDPRRPLTPPTAAEKEEGLSQYSPYLFVAPLSVVTFNETIPKVSLLVSSPSTVLESTTTVLVVGLDLFMARVTPSEGFDLLASDFNKTLLALILGGMFVAVVVLRQLSKTKSVAQGWA